MKDTRTILHIDLDSFFVSCERLLDSRLNNRPILVGGTSSRGVVASCSYETRVFGVHSGMPMKMAKELCPEAVVIHGNSGIYSKYSDVITDIIKESAPLYEKSSIDEFYVDLSGMDKFFGSIQWSHELRSRIGKETGLPTSFGLSINKTVAKVGTNEAKPNNFRNIPVGTEREFLAPLSVRKIPMVGEKTYFFLRSMGLRKIKTVQEMPKELIQKALGQNGLNLWYKANAIDNSPVVSYHERKSISLERTFERDTADLTKLKSLIIAMTESLAYQLRKGNKLTSCVSIKIRYADFSTHSKQARISYTSSDHSLINRVTELFEKLHQRRLMIRLVGVRFSHLVEGGYQINLLEDTEELINLYHAMDKIRNRFGQDAVKRAIGVGSRGIGPMSNPFNGQPPVIPAHRRS